MTPLWLWTATSVAQALEPARVAVVVTALQGVAPDTPLKWANHDGDRVAEALVALGGVREEDLVRRPDASLVDAVDAFAFARERVAAHRAEGRPTELIVYYTGHAGADGLHLDGEALGLDRLKREARSVGAERLLVVLDSCQSGLLFRAQGARWVPEVEVPIELEPPSGEAWLASSGAEQWSFEADERRGALFTHFFVTALRGGADEDADGLVTLTEVASFTRAQAATAAASLGQLQEPRLAGDLGAMVLASPGYAPSGLHVQGPVISPVLVVSRERCEGGCRVVAEVPVGAGASLALEPGAWQLVSREGWSGPQAVDLRLDAGEWIAVDPARTLVASSGVRSLGGLVVTHPRGIGVDYALATLPGSPLAQGLTLSAHVRRGRGQAVSALVSAGRAAFDNGVAAGHSDRVTAALAWRYDLLDAGARLSLGARAGGGVVSQKAARVPTEVWGAWYGERDAAVAQRLGEAHTRAEISAISGGTSWSWQATLGLGVEWVGATLAPSAQLEIGVRRAFRGRS